MTGFIDSSLMLDLVEETERAKAFRRLSKGLPVEWCASPLVRMECRVRALAEGKALTLSRVDAILASVCLLTLTDEVFERAAEIRAQTGLKTPDALHVATALTHGCAEFWTADARMARAAVPGLAMRLVA